MSLLQFVVRSVGGICKVQGCFRSDYAYVLNALPADAPLSVLMDHPSGGGS